MKKTILKAMALSVTLLGGYTAHSQISSFPYLEDFETFNTCAGSCNSTCMLPVSGNPLNDWLNVSGEGAEWTVDVGGTSSSSTGPSVDYTLGTSAGKYLYLESSSPCSPSITALLQSPSLDLSGVSAMNMVFAYHMYGATMGTLSVDVSTDGGGTWIPNLWTLTGDQGDVWYADTVSLGAFAGNSNVIVRFRGVTGSSFTSDMAIDQVSFYEPLPNDAGVTAIPSPGFPSCNLTNATVSATVRNFGFNSLTSATINWSVNGLPQTPYSWTGTAPAGTEFTQSIGTYSFVDGDVLAVWTSMPNGVSETGSGPMNDSTILTIQSGLSGVYTIGATGNYMTFADAVNALNIYGVCSAVTFNVEDGVYNEQVSLGEVLGVSDINTITFQSANADPSLVTLTYAPTLSTANYTVQLNGTDYVTFKDLTISSTGTTYATVLLMENGAENNTFDGNMILGNVTSTSTSTNNAVIYSPSGNLNNMNTFVDNSVQYGSYGIYWYGVGTGNTTNGLRLEGNDFTDHYYRAAHLYYTDSNTIVGNTFATSGGYTFTNYAMYVFSMAGQNEISNNTYYTPVYGYDLYLSSASSTPGARSKMFNNTFVVEDSVSTSTSYGVYCTTVNNWDIMNNSVNMISQGTSSRAFYFSGGGGIDFYNNNVRNDGPGYGVYYLSGLNASNNNNLYVPNGNVGYAGSNQLTLADWQTATLFDLNSVSGDPGYFSSTDLHTCNDTLLDGAGMAVAYILTDFDGQTRDTNNFDIGADEFLGLSNFGFMQDSVWKCSSATVDLGGWEPANDGTYLWSTTETTPSIAAATPGAYSVTVTTGCGSAISSIIVEDIPDAVADFSSTTSFVTGIFTSNASGTIDSYSWDFGDGSAGSTQENPLHVFPSTGTFTVTLTVTGPCGTDTYTETITLEVADLDENELGAALSVYPNPNNGEFTVNLKLENVSNVSAVLVDARGQEIWNSNFGSVNGTATETINVSANAAGVYFLKVTADDRSSVRKVVIKK